MPRTQPSPPRQRPARPGPGWKRPGRLPRPTARRCRPRPPTRRRPDRHPQSPNRPRPGRPAAGRPAAWHEPVGSPGRANLRLGRGRRRGRRQRDGPVPGCGRPCCRAGVPPRPAARNASRGSARDGARTATRRPAPARQTCRRENPGTDPSPHPDGQPRGAARHGLRSPCDHALTAVAVRRATGRSPPRRPQRAGAPGRAVRARASRWTAMLPSRPAATPHSAAMPIAGSRFGSSTMEPPRPPVSDGSPMPNSDRP